MTKKTILIVIALVLMTTVLAACPSENTGSFKPVEMPAKSTIADNGGVAVVYGEYTYFVNGSSDAASDNTYNKVVTGAVCRVKTEEIGSEDAVFEIVVPKIFYKGNADSTGLFASGDRIYFTTPGVEKNNNGEFKSGELSIISAKVTGEDVKIHVTISSNTAPVFFFEKNGTVSAVYYVDSKLYSVDLSTNKPVVVAENVTAVKADSEAVYALQKLTYKDSKDKEQTRKYNDVLKYVVGDKEATAVLKGAAADNSHSVDITYTLVRVDAGKLYYTAASTNVGFAGTFVFDGKEKRLSANAQSSFLPYKDGILMLNDSFVCYVVYDEATGAVSSEKLIYTSSFTPVKVDGDVVYYTNSNKLYKAVIEEGKIAEPVALTSSSMSDTNLSFDIIGDSVFFIESSGKKMTRAILGEKDKIEETTLQYTKPE